MVVEVADGVEAVAVVADGLDYRSIGFDPHQTCTYIVNMVSVGPFTSTFGVLIASFVVIPGSALSILRHIISSALL